MAESGTTGGAALSLELIKCIHDVAQKMESISNLDCIGCAPTNSISDAETAIARHDFGPWVLTQPSCQRRGLVVTQYFNWPAHCQIDEQQPIARRSTVQPEIIHP